MKICSDTRIIKVWKIIFIKNNISRNFNGSSLKIEGYITLFMRFKSKKDTW